MRIRIRDVGLEDFDAAFKTWMGKVNSEPFRGAAKETLLLDKVTIQPLIPPLTFNNQDLQPPSRYDLDCEFKEREGGWNNIVGFVRPDPPPYEVADFNKMLDTFKRDR